MRRSLRKRIIRVAHNLTQRQRDVRIVVLFPREAFDEVPRWSPGEDFVPAIDYCSWYRLEPLDMTTAVVGGVYAVGGDQPELWTVRLDRATSDGRDLFSELWNKPYRLRSLMMPPEDTDYGRSCVVNRETITDSHPYAVMHRFWESFESVQGFVPSFAHGRGVMGCPWITFSWTPQSYIAEEEFMDILDAVAGLEKQWDIRVRVYPDNCTPLWGNDYAWLIAKRYR